MEIQKREVRSYEVKLMCGGKCVGEFAPAQEAHYGLKVWGEQKYLHKCGVCKREVQSNRLYPYIEHRVVV